MACAPCSFIASTTFTDNILQLAVAEAYQSGSTNVPFQDASLSHPPRLRIEDVPVVGPYVLFESAASLAMSF